MKRRGNAGATALALPLLVDGEWHSLTEIAEAIKPVVVSGTLIDVASDLMSQLNCERLGIRGRDDQQARWRPDIYLNDAQKGHDRIQFKAGADAVLKGLLGLRSFQQLIVQPGQQLNPTQRYWLDKALEMTKTRIADGGD